MLQSLTREPEILYTVTMLSTGGLDLRRQGAENASGRAIDRQQRLTFQTPEGRQPPLTSSCIGSNLRAEAQLRQSYRRDEEGLAVGQRLHIGGGEDAPLHVNPHGGVHQEAHGSRMPLSSRLPLHRP